MMLRLSDAAISALECSGVCEPETDREQVLARAWQGSRLMVTAETADAIGFALNDLANAEDESARRDRDPEMRRHARRACRALSALAARAFRVR